MDWFDMLVLGGCAIALLMLIVKSAMEGTPTRSQMEAKGRRLGDVWGHEDWMCFEGMCFRSSAFLARWRLICILATDRVRTRPW